MMYQIPSNPMYQGLFIIRNNSDWIPFDPANTDAQAFAKWLKDGGTPEPAEEDGAVTAEWIAETIAKLLPNG